MPDLLDPTKSPALRFAAAAVALVAFTGVACDDGAEVEEVTETTETSAAATDARSFVAADSSDDRDAVAGSEGPGEASLASASTGQMLTVQKQYPERIAAGSEITYLINLSNDSDQDLRGVVLKEALPEGFEIKSTEPKAAENNDGTLVFRLGDMETGGATQVAITGTPHTVGSVYACTSYDFERGVCVPFEVVNPNLKLTRQVSADRANVCDPVTVTYTLTNTGDTVARDVTLFEELPQGLALQEGEQISFEIGELPAGQSVEKQVQVFPEQAGEYSSYAFAKSELDDVESQRGDLVVVAPQLDVQINSPRDYAYIGDDARFEVVVINNGEGAAHDVQVDIGHEGVGEIAYIGNRGDAQLASGELGEEGLSLGALEPGDRRRFYVEVNTGQEGDLRLNAVARAVCGRTDQAYAEADSNATLAVVPISALQVEVIDSQDPVQAGSETVYEITVLNEGSGAASNLIVSADLPKGFSFVEAQGVTNAKNEDGAVHFEQVPTLPAGEAATWYIKVRAEEASGNQKLSVNAKTDQVNVTEQEPTRAY